MARALRVCSTPGCPVLVPQGTGRCDDCRAKADAARGSSTSRGYGHKHRTRFRDGVLRKDPTCQCRVEGHGHGVPCGAVSTQADHDPLGRDELIAAGLNPNDPRYGVGKCDSCHSKVTTVKQPGGWNAH